MGTYSFPPDSKEDRGCSLDSLAQLESHIYEYYPGLKGHKILGTYAGLRPHTAQNKDYQIRFNADKTFATLGAIRSTGLTASRGRS